jgi:aminoacrylate hydrolase
MAYYTADDGCRIYYELFGNCGPRVVLIPGLGGDGRFWSGVVSELCDDFSLIVVDHRGAGRSDRPQSVYSIGRIAADIAGVCASECGNAHFVGHSTGGAIAQTLALDHPQLGLSYTISSSWARADERFRSLFKARLELLENGLTEAYQRLTHVFGHETSYLEAHSERLADAVCTATEVLAPLPVAAARVRMLLDHDRLSELARLIAPVHVIARRQRYSDTAGNVRNHRQRRLRRKIDKARRCPFPSADTATAVCCRLQTFSRGNLP